MLRRLARWLTGKSKIVTDREVLAVLVERQYEWVSMHDLRAQFDGRWHASSVYARLARLQRDGMVTARWKDTDPPTREFQVTLHGWSYWAELEFGVPEDVVTDMMWERDHLPPEERHTIRRLAGGDRP